MLHLMIAVIKLCNVRTLSPVTGSTDGELGVRPLDARSLVLSVLLGLPTPRLPAPALMRLTEPFGIPPGTMRTALSRMVARGELANHGGAYELRAGSSNARKPRTSPADRRGTSGTGRGGWSR